MTMRKSAIDALDENHLWPEMTQSVAVADGARAQQRGVRARAGLGHGEGGLQVAREERVQVAVLLLGRAGQREDLGVARVGRLAAEGVRGPRRRAEDLVHEPELDLAEALAAELGRQVRGPQPAGLDLLLQRRVDPVEPAWSSSSTTVSSGHSSSRTNSRIQASSRSNSGSVEKSQLIGQRPPSAAR
jgi:hypothetical protein